MKVERIALLIIFPNANRTPVQQIFNDGRQAIFASSLLHFPLQIRHRVSQTLLQSIYSGHGDVELRALLTLGLYSAAMQRVRVHSLARNGPFPSIIQYLGGTEADLGAPYTVLAGADGAAIEAHG